MQRKIKMSASLILPLAILLTLAMPALAQRSVTVPTGTVVPLKMDTYLSSETSGAGDRFTATVSRDVVVDGRIAIPSGAKVEGHVTSADRADRRSRAGTIGIAFDRLVFPGGESMPVDATLTSLDESARSQIDNADSVDSEDNVEGGSRTRKAVVFIGGGAGAGAVIGAVAGGAKGAAVGAGVGAVLGTIGVLLSKGEKAEVTPGTEFGMQVERSFTASTFGESRDSSSGVAGDFDPGTQDPQDRDFQGRGSVLTSVEAIRSAQAVLRDRGLYNGPVNGVMTPGTRAAIRQFQRERNLTETGDLDWRTGQALGIVGERGGQTVLVEVENPRAQRVNRNTVRYNLTARTRTGGYRVFTDHFVNGDTLHVYVRGVPPRSAATGAIDSHQVEQTVDNATGVNRVVFHGSDRDITVDLSSGGGGGGGPVGGSGNPRQISFLANRLLTDFARDLNLRAVRGQVTFDRGRNLRGPEVELLFHINSLAAASDLYSQMAATVTDPEALRSAAESLSRQVRLVQRAMRRNEANLRLSSVVTGDWDQLRVELRNIGLTDSILDNDPDR